MIVPPLSTRDVAIHQQAMAGAKINMARLSAVGGDQWTVIRRKESGITAPVDVELGTITGHALAPTDANIVAGPGAVLVQRDAWIMLVPVPAAVILKQGLHVKSLAVPTMRFVIKTIDSTDNPGYLELTLEPA